MKAYCMNCGHPNEYSGAMPKKCEKCSTDFTIARLEFKIPMPLKKDGASIQEIVQDQLEGSEFDSFMEGDPEPFSMEEIQNIFLKDADRGINLKDMVAEGMARAAKQEKQTKPKPTNKRRSAKRK